MVLSLFFSELRIDIFEQTPSYGFFRLVGKLINSYVISDWCIFIFLLFFLLFKCPRSYNQTTFRLISLIGPLQLSHHLANFS